MPKTKIAKNESGFFETRIGAHKYEFQKWGAEQSLSVLTDLGTLIGEPLADVIASVTVKGPRQAEISELQMASLIRMLLAALKREKEAVLAMIRNLVGAEGVFVDGKAFPAFVQFDTHYDDLNHMFEVVGAALEVQYGSFFAGLATSGGLKLLRDMAVGQRASTPGPGAIPTT